MKLFILTVIATLHFTAALPQSPHATFSQMKVDDSVFCRELCKYDLSGPGCSVDCKDVEKVENFEVSSDFCDILCKHGLGSNRCNCADKENFVKNDKVLVCFGFYVYHKINLNGCPDCPFQGMTHYKPTTPGGESGSHPTRPAGNPYAHLIVTDEDKRLASEVKKMYCDYTCKNHPERGGGYCKCAKE